MLELDELKKLHDKAYNSGQVTRENASDDLVFYYVTQWDDNLIEDSNLLFRGEFNVLRKAGRQIMGDLQANPVQVDFKPEDDAREDGAELLDGLYRQDDRLNTSIESYMYAAQDAVVAGFGAWELYTEYCSNRVGDNRQVIRRRNLSEAANTVFWDPNAKRLDKSDAKYVSCLTAYSEDGYKDLVKELTGDEVEGNVWQSFKFPEQSYSFPWTSEAKKIYVTNFYFRGKVKDKAITFADPVGDVVVYRGSEVDQHMDELIDAGYEIVDEKAIERFQVTKYIASGAEILSEDIIAGEHIPVIPVYGERAIVEGEEHYEGITRLAKDPQRLRNFQLSYLADIVSKSPRQKPIFTAEQIQGFEDMYDISGAENDYPYLMQNTFDANGNPLPIGPVGIMPDSPIPQALAASIELTRQAVEDVANPGVPQDLADPDLSGKAVIALQNRMDQQSYIYQHNMKFAKRRDGEVYASMASEVYDEQRSVTVSKADGNQMQMQVMDTVQDPETGEFEVLNDLTNMEFNVYSDIGPSYQSQKEQTIDRLEGLAQSVAATDPALHRAYVLKINELMPGVNMDDIREYSRKQLLLMGFKEPETEEDKKFLAESQQQQQPDANMVLAQAENKKADADIMKAQNDTTRLNLELGKIQQRGQEIDINRAKSVADIQNTNADTVKKMTEAEQTAQETKSQTMKDLIMEMPTDKLVRQLM
jgi:hypothetical protein